MEVMASDLNRHRQSCLLKIDCFNKEKMWGGKSELGQNNVQTAEGVLVGE